MTVRRIRIERVRLGYGGGIVLHTATSGAVPELKELRLLVEDGGQLTALGATRTNIAYLANISEADIEAAVLSAVRVVDWRLGWGELIASLDRRLPRLAAPARMLLEMAFADGAAREAGVPLARHLGAPAGPLPTTTETNQTLFWQDDESLLRRARGYVDRGFLQLKLRIGIGSFEDDLRRLSMLRRALGAGLRLSVDANGRWESEEAPARLRALAELGVEYVEQPLAAGAWEETARLSRASPLPIMLDESLSSMAAVRQLVETRAAPLAHLKLAKLGGLDRLVAAARDLAAAGIGFMVGQMNEGAVSTLAAAHAAIAVGAPLRELYGADQIEGEPALPYLVYRHGLLDIPPGAGLGMAQRASAQSTVLFEEVLS